MCQQHNAILNTRFGQPAKLIIRRLLGSSGNALLDAAEVEVAALWYVKTWILLTHPKVVWSQPGWDPRPWEPAAIDLYGWMVSGQPPPLGLSAWAFKHGGRRVADDDVRRLPLITMVVDGQTVQFQAMCLAQGAIEVQLAYHPGWEIDHPLEREHRAVRLWPRPSAGEADFAALSIVERGDVRWSQGSLLMFPPGTSPTGYPPLSETGEAIHFARSRGANLIMHAAL